MAPVTAIELGHTAAGRRSVECLLTEPADTVETGQHCGREARVTVERAYTPQGRPRRPRWQRGRVRATAAHRVEAEVCIRTLLRDAVRGAGRA